MHEAPVGRPGWTLPPIPAVLLSITSIQIGAALAKGLFPALGAAGTSGTRLVLASLLLLAVFRPPVTRFTRAQWAAVVPYGLALGTMNLTYYLALARIPLGPTVTLEFVGPLVLAMAGSRRLLDFVWAVVAALGVVLLVPWSPGAGALDRVGVLLALFAGACWAAYIVLGGRLSQRMSEGQGVASGMIFATLVVLPFALADDVAGKFTPSLLLAGLGVALLSSALPYTLELMALKVLPSRTFGILMSLEPAVAALMGLVILHEQLSPLQGLAVVLVSVASAGTTLTARRPPPPVEV